MTRPSPKVSQPLAGPSNKSTVEEDVPNDQSFSEPTDVDMDVAPAPLPEKRPRRTPRHLVDFLPSDSRPIQQFSKEYDRLAEVQQQKRRRLDSPLPPQHVTPNAQPEPLETVPNENGLFRRYNIAPSRDPDEELTIYHVADAPGFIRDGNDMTDPLSGFGPTAQEVARSSNEGSRASTFFPFLNASVFRLMSWFYSSKNLTLAALDRLVNDVILAPDFNTQHFKGFSAIRENKRLEDKSPDQDHGPKLPWSTNDNWIEGSVEIPLPPPSGTSFKSERHAPTMQISFFHRNLVEAFKSGVQDYASRKFHWRGFRQFWKPSDNEPEQRVYGEAYTSDEWLDLEGSIDPVEGCNLEAVVVPLMLYSDSTHLASFGNASLWPVYMWFGGLSKYIRGKVTSFSAHHLVYLPSLPDLVKDTYTKTFGNSPTAAVLTHLRRELIQAVWKHLLTPEFKEIYKNGIVLKCGDGIWRRLYPRFFTYSADYKERVLLVGIKHIGEFLCATCRITLTQLERLGTKLHDIIWSRNLRTDSVAQNLRIKKARKLIFEKGKVVNGKPIDRALGESLVPIENAFSQLLLPHDRNYFSLFTRDLMHEIELGVWRSLFLHLLRILHTYGREAVATLDYRYRKISPFGRSTIRRFHEDVSAMKGLAARDFEDLLQNAGPCFEGLFLGTSKAVDNKIQDLLFTMASWHASAKMRLHTEWSLSIFEGMTRSLNRHFRVFKMKVCILFNTKETPKEVNASIRRRAATEAKTTGPRPAVNTTTQSTPREKTFNIKTPKMHSITHYPAAIRRFGTTDSYSTQPGEKEHTHVKAFWARTNKNQFEKQITQQERRETRSRVLSRTSEEDDDDDVPPIDPSDHHYISRTSQTHHNILQFVNDHVDDPAVENFTSKLVDHLLERILPQETTATDELRGQLIIRDHRIYEHKTLRINYTTYDNR
ncbi:hypothetical protein H0H93_016314, partial [Arthromyces matolae]